AVPAATARLLWPSSTASAPTTIVSQPSPVGSDRPEAAPRRSQARWRGAESAKLPAEKAVRAQALMEGFYRFDADRAVQFVALIWLLGVGTLLTRAAGGWWRVRTLHRTALAQAASRWQPACRRIASRLGLKSAAHVIESIAVEVPTVVGWLRPVILLPVSAVAALAPPPLAALPAPHPPPLPPP